jgi:hypothetical protein
MFDSTMKNLFVIADTAAGAPNPYGVQGITGLIPYIGDSSLFIDVQAQAMIVVDPNGKMGRVMAPPKAQDLSQMSRSPGFDPKGRLIYRSSRRPPPGSERRPEPGQTLTSVMPDSAPVMRADFDSRTVDTVIMFRIPIQKIVNVSPQPGMTMGTVAFNPLPVSDEWALLPDGTIAIVRGQDYHIDWFGMDGKLTSTPKMPFDWKRVTTEEKEHLLDSLKKAAEAREAAGATVPGTTGAGGRGGDVGRGGPPPPPPGGARGDVRFTEMMVGPGGTPMPMPRIPFTTVDVADLPDYYPPVRAGQVRADPDGNVWILPSTSTLSAGTLIGPQPANASGLVYDVVGRDGVVRERVILPVGRNLAALGPHGTVYMLYSPAPGRAVLERGRIVRTGSGVQQ